MKTAVITGASRGIGLACAKLFLAKGFHVIGTSTSGSLPLNSEFLFSVRLDLSDKEGIERAIQQIKSHTNEVDVLVNNAAIILDADRETPDLERIRKTFEVDVFGTIQFTEALLPSLAASGRILNVSSICGSFSDPVDDETSLGYRMAKASLNMYTRSLALRMQSTRVLVAAIDPGWVDTDMGNSVATDGERPPQTVEETAQDIYRLATGDIENGRFWRFGKKRAW